VTLCAGAEGHFPPSHLERPPQVAAVVQLVRIPACHAGGRGFESRPLRQLNQSLKRSLGLLARASSIVRLMSLAGAGELGELVRSIDWGKTPLGSLAKWPQSLRTTMSICLNSRFRIAVFAPRVSDVVGRSDAVGSGGGRCSLTVMSAAAAAISDITKNGLTHAKPTTGNGCISSSLSTPKRSCVIPFG
jgi:hypothetical protein